MADDWESLLDEPEPEVKPAAKAPVAVKQPLNVNNVSKPIQNEVKPAAKVLPKATAPQVNEDPLSHKLRMAKLAVDSDMDSAADLFGVARKSDSRTTQSSVNESVSSLDQLFDPESIDDFEALADELIQRLKPLDKRAGYVFFMEKFIRALTPSLAYEDSRQLASALTVISNERLRADKESAKPKKKPTAAQKKGHVRVGHAMDNHDDDDGSNDLGDDYDY